MKKKRIDLEEDLLEKEEDHLRQQPCTVDNVRTYLVFLLDDEEKAEELVQNHVDRVSEGEEMGSFTYYVVDQILEAESEVE